MSLAGVRVRAAVEDDLAGVVALERSAAEAPHWAETVYREILRLSRGPSRDEIMRRCFFVAEVEGSLAGFIVGKVIGMGQEGMGELESVVVRVESRRRGVGRALCHAAGEWCRGQGAAAIELEVRAGSAGAIALYGGLGFVVTGRRTAYYREPVDDAVLMRIDWAGTQ